MALHTAFGSFLDHPILHRLLLLFCRIAIGITIVKRPRTIIWMEHYIRSILLLLLLFCFLLT